MKPVKTPVRQARWPFAEYKAVCLREMAPWDAARKLDEPQRARDYWRDCIAASPHFMGAVETVDVVMLNARMRLIGNYVCALGLVDTLLVHPRETFRIAIMANATSIVAMHNLCVAAHKLCYVERRFM